MCKISLTRRDDFPPDHRVTDGATPFSARTNDAHKICHACASSTLHRQKGAPPKVSHAINEGCPDFCINSRMRERIEYIECVAKITRHVSDYVHDRERVWFICRGRKICGERRKMTAKLRSAGSGEVTAMKYKSSYIYIYIYIYICDTFFNLTCRGLAVQTGEGKKSNSGGGDMTAYNRICTGEISLSLSLSLSLYGRFHYVGGR